MTKPGFTEQWFGEGSQSVLALLTHVVRTLPGLIVEIGAWEGRSTCALANAAYPRMVHTCDTWKGSPDELSEKLAGERDVFAQFKANIAAFTKGNVLVHHGGWRDFLPTITEPVALAFIDAEHTRVEVRDNIRAFLPLIWPGGIICGDDNHDPEVMAGVFDVLPLDEVYADASVWLWQKPPETPLEAPQNDETSPLAHMYLDQCHTPSDIYRHLPRFAQMVLDLDAKHVIELGSRTGRSTIAWLMALELTGGRLTSVDLDPPPPLGEFDHWTHIQGDDLSPAVLAQLEPADIVFIDTSHHLWQTRAELAVYKHLARRLIVCHDTELEAPHGYTPPPAYPVKVAVEEFAAAHDYPVKFFTDSYGLAIIDVGGHHQ